MPEELNLDQFIQDKKSKNFDINLQELLSKDIDKFENKEIKLLEDYESKVWKLHCDIDSLKYKHSDNPNIKIKTLELLELFISINIKLGDILSTTKAKSDEHHYGLLIGSSQKYTVALQKKYAILRERDVVSNVLANARGRAFSETESPYHNIKKLIGIVKRNYDEVAVWFMSNNNFKNAHNYYYFLGDIIIKEIFYGSEINDKILYKDSNYAYLYYSAGLSFLRGYNAIKEKFITVHYASPMATHFKSNISDLFNNGNVMIPINELAIKCFEKAITLFKTTGNKTYYLKTKDILRNLKSELNDFEQIIIDIYLKITKQFTSKSNVVTKSVSRALNILEGDVRDYYLSHINIIRDELAFAESTRGRDGFADLLVVGKDYRENVINSIAEFKVWGRNSSGDHSYLNVINQLKTYISDFESFGIIVMINPNQSSIRQNYLDKIINADATLIPNSLDEPHNETGFTNFKSEHYIDESQTRKIKIYHFIINISNLYSVEVPQ